MAFQPLVDLRQRKVFAYEALARPKHPEWTNPERLFHEAVAKNVCGELGRLIRHIATDACGDWPLFLNIHPKEFDDGWLIRPDDPIFRHEHQIYLEITESVPMSHEAWCHGTLREIRDKGIRVAVDDLGAGYSNLKYIADLEPEVVKLDRQLTTNLTTDSRMFKLVSSVVRLCEDLGAIVVAEGIETRSELRSVIEAGVALGQGYLLARPAFTPPQPDWSVF
jgi:EAL domain-containing protein (putative c-di-GMP-specific phosphodiesterase class I)